MDEETEKYEPNEFLEKNRCFLKDYSFKFEGLSPECEKGFTHIVMDLGGNVSNKAKYILVEKSYFEKNENKKRKDLYHLNFILDSLEHGKPLDIELYRCDRTCNSCSNEDKENSPSILQNRSNKHNYKNSNTTVRNNRVVESDSDDDMPISEMVNKSKSQDNDKVLEKSNSQIIQKKHNNIRSDTESNSSDKSVNVKQEPISSESSDDDSEEENKTVSKWKTVKVKREANSSDDSSNETDSEPTIRKRRKKNSDFPAQTNLQKHVSPNKTKVNTSNNDIDSSSQDGTNDETDSEPFSRKIKKKQSNLKTQTNCKKSPVSQNKTNAKAGTRTWVDTKDLKNSKTKTKNNNEENSPSNSGIEWTKTKVEERPDLKWLFQLDKDDLCTRKKCTFEPSDSLHNNHDYAGRVISEEEKLVILKYLIKNNLIHGAKGSKTWERMTAEGYLTHRSTETLRNCLRRIILPNICKYNLPIDILDQFLHLEEKKTKGKKSWCS